MSKTSSKYSREAGERAVRMVLDNTRQHESCWSAIVSISGRIGRSAPTLNERVKKAEGDSAMRVCPAFLTDRYSTT